VAVTVLRVQYTERSDLLESSGSLVWNGRSVCSSTYRTSSIAVSSGVRGTENGFSVPTNATQQLLISLFQLLVALYYSITRFVYEFPPIGVEQMRRIQFTRRRVAHFSISMIVGSAGCLAGGEPSSETKSAVEWYKPG
jgi:hypothetical protein